MFAVVMAFLAPILHSSCNLLDSHFANNLIKSNSAIIFYNSLTNVVAIPFLLLFGLPQPISWELLPFLLIIAATETFYLPTIMPCAKLTLRSPAPCFRWPMS